MDLIIMVLYLIFKVLDLILELISFSNSLLYEKESLYKAFQGLGSLFPLFFIECNCISI